MAYPNGIGPSGLVPVNLLGGRVYSGAIRQIPIASAYAQNIGYGDFVTYTTDGTIIRIDTAAGAKAAFATPPVGIFLGCQYTQASGLKYPLWSQYWPTGTAIGTDNENYGYGWAYVCEDPDAIFVATVSDASGNLYTSGAATQASVGLNAGYYVKTGLVNTTTGDSLVTVNLASAATTNTLPLRIVDVVRSTALSDGTYQQVLVTFNAGFHFYRQTTGI
jgi:hypothetical protein